MTCYQAMGRNRVLLAFLLFQGMINVSYLAAAEDATSSRSAYFATHVVYMTDFTAKMPQVIYFVIEVKATFVKCDMRFSSALESSACLKLT